ncbi:CDP-glycerol glycerophosphotransferase family protein [Treponema zuelzerae]|uniref:CDP-glycerol glycerophosphotransferase family protein n=1 Tax=Teretinema zuelzerae TaxID=156 RepID=A0AAE3JJW7_9SPIR|nr:CDP-glycerol glycerophosphotransferase family protein [Teretinema zuelzerae]MCD1654655.1 CDP-glycerol glycerophosphotransferase family protein [Teretinema zuelzerae]
MKLKKTAQFFIVRIIRIADALRIFAIKTFVTLGVKRKFRILFLVNDNTKWNAQSVFEVFRKDPRFDARIFVCRQEQSESEKKTRNGYAEDCAFFRKRNIPFIPGYDESIKKDIPVSSYSPDLVFYIQPWGWTRKLYDLTTIRKKSLTAYIPYSLPICNDPNDNQLTFHQLITFFYVPSAISLKLNQKEMLNKGKNCVVSGYPKLDDYAKPVQKTKNQPKILYAPHHSFSGRLRFATFRWNGREMLEYARRHSEISWVFKPHPRLKYELVEQKIMTLEEANDYYDSWASMDNSEFYNSGDYIRLFQESDLLITDCISFLGEYLPSGNPVILLENTESAGYNELGKEIISSYYSCKAWNEVEMAIERIVIKKQDPLNEIRNNTLDRVYLKKSSSKMIYEHIVNTFFNRIG